MPFTAKVQIIDHEQQLVNLLHRYLSAVQKDYLRVRVPWNMVYVHGILYRERKDNPASFYDPDRRILTVKVRGEHSRRRVSCVVYNLFLFFFFPPLTGCLIRFLTGSKIELLCPGSSVHLKWKLTRIGEDMPVDKE